MIKISLSATDEELLQIVRGWLDMFVTEDYERIFSEIGYALAQGRGSNGIREDIERYRSPELYPGVSKFRVTDWRTAQGGNPDPKTLVRRYKYNENLPIVVTVEVDLPLNGQWSDLQAAFVVTAKSSDATFGTLCLEDIRSFNISSTDVD